MQAINPATGQVVATYASHGDDETEVRLATAWEAHLHFRSTPMGERADALMRVAALLRERRDEHARLMADEMGKPLEQGRAESDKCAWVCEYYAEHGERFLSDQRVSTEQTRSYVAFRPLGLVLAVMPWNFPFWQVFRFAAPALMAGNGALLKHASNVPGCALAIERVMLDAGLSKGVFSTLLVGSEQVARLIADPRVAAVTLTGSTPAGRAVARCAGGHLKKTVLELGGSDPYIVLEDADLDSTADACVTSRLLNSGQSCIAAKRFVVVDAVREELERRMVERMGRAVVGDPCHPSTQVGPLAREDLRDDLHRQVERSLERGARLLLGGQIPNRRGAFYPPTVLTDVAPGMAAYDEELFGPVAAIIPVPDEEEAIRVANDTPFGLGAAVFTKDAVRGEAIARDRLHAGACSVNDFVRSDPRLPFGGIKESGYGRELSSMGILEFVNAKSVTVR